MPSIPRFRLRLSDKDLWETREDMRKTEEHNYETVRKFEKQFAKYIRRKFAIFMPSARYSLYRILRFMGLEAGDHVIVPAWTHSSVPSMVVHAGLKPLFADIEGGTYNMTHNTIPKDYWKTAKAIIMTHIYGCPAPANEIKQLANRYNVKIIEDCSQSCGSSVYGQMTGSFGYASIFSTGFTKNLPTLTGGFAVTDDPTLAKHLSDSRDRHFYPTQEVKRIMRTCFYINHFTSPHMFNTVTFYFLMLAVSMGWDFVHKWHQEPVLSEKPSIKLPCPHPVQAKLGSRMLENLDQFNKQITTNGEMLLGHLKGIRGVIIPRQIKGHQHIFTGFVIMVDNPWEVKKALIKKGIDTAPGYLMNCADAEEFDEFKVKCNMAERMQAMRLHLPCFENLYKDQIHEMARVVVHLTGR